MTNKSKIIQDINKLFDEAIEKETDRLFCLSVAMLIDDKETDKKIKWFIETKLKEAALLYLRKICMQKIDEYTKEEGNE